MTPPVRTLLMILGDQLDGTAPWLADLDPARDCVFMAEVDEESTHVWSHKARTVLFLSAMRHLRDELVGRGLRVRYVRLDESGNTGALASELMRAVRALRPEVVRWVHPGDWRVRESLRAAMAELQASGLVVAHEELEDTRFLCSREAFEGFARGRKQLRMEHFYRDMRRRHRVLVDEDERGRLQPCGGSWNFDHDNRGAFDARGPGLVPPPPRFEPDAITREVMELVARRYADHPGSLEEFCWPVTAAQAVEALEAFVRDRLPDFGRTQDAMWTGEPFLYHALLSSSMNLGLLDPRAVIARVEAAWRAGGVPIAAAEGFIRQILGWREYVRGVYWLRMPGAADDNALGARLPLPGAYWTGETELRCVREAVTQTLGLGYAHHIQRLMVTGLYAMLLGVDPREVHRWYLAVYVDAVEWVELPNTMAMSQHADGGLMMSKPYAASGKYIDRMSDYCAGCRYRPEQATGPDACPMTTLYWDFLERHHERFAAHPRMVMQVRNLERRSAAEREAIRAAAAAHRRAVLGEP